MISKGFCELSSKEKNFRVTQKKNIKNHEKPVISRVCELSSKEADFRGSII